MHGHKVQIEATLRQAAVLPPREHLVATWGGYLMELRPVRPFIDAPARPTAVLGVTDSAIYLISETALLRITFGQLRGPHSPYRNVLRFSVVDGHDVPVVVTVAVRGARAIADQLNDTMRRPALPAVGRRPRAKRRPYADYVD